MSNDKEEIQKLCNKYKRLKQYRGKSEAELLELATDKYNEKLEDIELTGKFKSRKEKKYATILARKYSADYSIETVSDKNQLNQIIYYEVLQDRLQEKLNSFFEEDKKAIPFDLVEMVHKNSKIIISLKDTLGINRSKEEKSGYDVFDHYKKRVKKWLSENQASRTFVCGHCGKFNLLKIRSEHWEAQKHPFFKDRVLYNKHLIQMYKDGKITSKDVAEVLECSSNYVDWVIGKIENPTAEKPESEEPKETKEIEAKEVKND